MGFIARAFTPGGGEAPEAIAQRAAGQARIDAEAAAKAQAQLLSRLNPPKPPAPPAFQAQAPGAAQRAATTAMSILGRGATGTEGAKKSLLG